MNIRIENETDRRIPQEHVQARISEALSRIDHGAASARVTFSDVNGPKGGADIRCGILVMVPGRPALRVESLQITPRLAFDETYARTVRRLDQLFRRRREVARRPKKYFAAKRLLFLTLALVAIPLQVLAQATPPSGDLELKAKKKTTVVAPKPAEGQAAKDADAAQRTTEQRRRVDAAAKPKAPARPDGDLSGGIQSKSIKGELGK